MDLCGIPLLVLDDIHGELIWIHFTLYAVWRLNRYKHVFIHVKNENKPFPVFASFGCPVHLKLVAKLTIQGGGYKGMADWEG